MKKIRIGIIGCGSIAEKRHIPEYLQNPNSEIVGFYDLNKMRAKQMAEKYGGKSYDSYQEMLVDENIDAISDCTPNFMHCKITTEAMKNGKAVLCEKPMAKSLQEAQEILKVQEETGQIFVLDHNQRFTEPHKYVKKLIKSEEYGKVISFRTTFGHDGPEKWATDVNWFFTKEKCEYGVVGDLGVHKLDLIRFLLEDEYDEVGAMGAILDKTFENENPIEVLDNSVAILKMKSGIIGTANFSWTYYGKEDNSTILYLENGIIKIYDDEKYQVRIFSNNMEEKNLEFEAIQTNKNQTKTGVIDSFINCIINKTLPLVSVEDGLISIKVVDALMRSIEEKKIFKI
ncbi:MAG: Gfo/Idh/MocA family protein [Fusobacteriaceae bacterium]